MKITFFARIENPMYIAPFHLSATTVKFTEKFFIAFLSIDSTQMQPVAYEWYFNASSSGHQLFSSMWDEKQTYSSSQLSIGIFPFNVRFVVWMCVCVSVFALPFTEWKLFKNVHVIVSYFMVFFFFFLVPFNTHLSLNKWLRMRSIFLARGVFVCEWICIGVGYGIGRALFHQILWLCVCQALIRTMEMMLPILWKLKAGKKWVLAYKQRTIHPTSPSDDIRFTAV